MSDKYYAHSCVLVTRESLVLYSPELTELVPIPMSNEILLDLEVINQPGLERIIKNWLRKSQFVPQSLAIYFVADTYFYQDVTQVPASIEDPTVISFVETVPFTDLVTKIFPTSGGARVIAINRDLLQPMISVFEKAGFSVVAATPSFAAGITSDNPFSPEVAKESLDDETVFTTYNFLEAKEAEERLESEKPFMSFKLNKKIIAMIAVFVVLIIILIVMIVTMT